MLRGLFSDESGRPTSRPCSATSKKIEDSSDLVCENWRRGRSNGDL